VRTWRHRVAKELARRQAASKQCCWNPNLGNLARFTRQPRCRPCNTLCLPPSLTVALPADRTQHHVTAGEATTDRDKPHRDNDEQIQSYKNREHTCFWSIVSYQIHRLWSGENEGSSGTPHIHCSWMSFSNYLFMSLASPCFLFPLSASFLGIGSSFTHVVFFYISFMRNSFLSQSHSSHLF